MLVHVNEIKDSKKLFAPWGYTFITYKDFATHSILPCRKQFFLTHMQWTDSFYLFLKRQLLIKYSNQLQNTLSQLD